MTASKADVNKLPDNCFMATSLCDADYPAMDGLWLLLYLMQNKEETVHLNLMFKKDQNSDIWQQVYVMQYSACWTTSLCDANYFSSAALNNKHFP